MNRYSYSTSQSADVGIKIAYYDRILVLDGGMVAEYDTVLGLFDKPSGSVFRSLCDEAGLTRGDIMRIRKDAGRD